MADNNEKMRIDLLLNRLCFAESRSTAKKACDKNMVRINGKVVKASATVKVGDIILIRLQGVEKEIRITGIPPIIGNLLKKDAAKYYDLRGNNGSH